MEKNCGIRGNEMLPKIRTLLICMSISNYSNENGTPQSRLG
jgi:hypothetical protein